MKLKKNKYINGTQYHCLLFICTGKLQWPPSCQRPFTQTLACVSVRLWKIKSNKTVGPIQMSLNPSSPFCSFLHFPHVYLCMWYIYRAKQPASHYNNNKKSVSHQKCRELVYSCAREEENTGIMKTSCSGQYPKSEKA